MQFTVRMGQPSMDALWKHLQQGAAAGTLSKTDVQLARKLGKTVGHLAGNPFHPGLQSHEIPPLTRRFGMKVFESYLENSTPSAGRLFWVYGPGRKEITVIGLEPHPDDTRAAYNRVSLDHLPPHEPSASTVLPPKPRPRRRK